MRDGIPYEEAARLAKVKNPLIVNPSARWGSSRIWTACKRAQKHGWIFIQWRPILLEDFAALFGSNE